jgi:hypothetical protein
MNLCVNDSPIAADVKIQILKRISDVIDDAYEDRIARGINRKENSGVYRRGAGVQPYGEPRKPDGTKDSMDSITKALTGITVDGINGLNAASTTDTMCAKCVNWVFSVLGFVVIFIILFVVTK